MRDYPFIPKSTLRLRPGDFWSIPLSNGHFGCGRVIELPPSGRPGSRTMFLAGLLDWSSASAPTPLTIAGRRVLEQGAVHLKALTENGGAILGNRPLELDGIEPAWFLDSSPGNNCMLMKGYEVMRAATLEEQARLPVFSTWGYRVIVGLAEDYFVKGKAKRPD